MFEEAMDCPKLARRIFDRICEPETGEMNLHAHALQARNIGR